MPTVIKNGMTLIELAIVVLIIGILAAISIPIYSDYVIKAKWAENVNIINGLAKQAMLCQQLYASACSGAVGTVSPSDIGLAAWPSGKYIKDIGVVYDSHVGFHIFMDSTLEVGGYHYSRGFSLLGGNTSAYVATQGLLDNVPTSILAPLKVDTSY